MDQEEITSQTRWLDNAELTERSSAVDTVMSGEDRRAFTVMENRSSWRYLSNWVTVALSETFSSKQSTDGRKKTTLVTESFKERWILIIGVQERDR